MTSYSINLEFIMEKQRAFGQTQIHQLRALSLVGVIDVLWGNVWVRFPNVKIQCLELYSQILHFLFII